MGVERDFPEKCQSLKQKKNDKGREERVKGYKKPRTPYLTPFHSKGGTKGAEARNVGNRNTQSPKLEELFSGQKETHQPRVEAVEYVGSGVDLGECSAIHAIKKQNKTKSVPVMCQRVGRRSLEAGGKLKWPSTIAEGHMPNQKKLVEVLPGWEKKKNYPA